MSEKKADTRRNRTRKKTKAENPDETGKSETSEETSKRKTPAKHSGTAARRGAGRSRKKSDAAGTAEKSGGSTSTAKKGSSASTAKKSGGSASTAKKSGGSSSKKASTGTAKKASGSSSGKKSSTGTAEKSSTGTAEKSSSGKGTKAGSAGSASKKSSGNSNGKAKSTGGSTAKKASSSAKQPAKKKETKENQSPRSPIENEVLALVEVDVDETDYTTYLRTLVAQIDAVDDETYDNLSEQTQQWFTDAAKTMNEGGDPPDPRKTAPSAAAKKEVADVSKKREDYNNGKGEHARKGKMSALLRDVICKNLEITASEALAEVEQHGYEPARGTFMTIFSYTRNALQHANKLGMLTHYKDVDHAK